MSICMKKVIYSSYFGFFIDLVCSTKLGRETRHLYPAKVHHGQAYFGIYRLYSGWQCKRSISQVHNCSNLFQIDGGKHTNPINLCHWSWSSIRYSTRAQSVHSHGHLNFFCPSNRRPSLFRLWCNSINVVGPVYCKVLAGDWYSVAFHTTHILGFHKEWLSTGLSATPIYATRDTGCAYKTR